MIRPDGSSQIDGLHGEKAVTCAWGLNIDGNDDVWHWQLLGVGWC